MAMGVVDLTRQLIRNACVNDGSAASGNEARNAELLGSELEGRGCDIQVYEPLPGRTSLVARIDGTDPGAPALCYLGHTDVVPANPDTWTRDPFGAELIDGEIWGRGAIDMLNLAAAMSVAFRRLAESGFRPRGSLILAAVADEEALGGHGAGWLAEHAAADVAADYVITETGGVPIDTPSGRRLPVILSEKGNCWSRIRIHGAGGHGSMPLRTDNAIVTAAELIRRLAACRPAATISDSWRQCVEAMAMPADLTAALLDPGRIEEACDTLADLGLARQAYSSTHLTIAPTIVHGGTKTNVIPDQVDLDLDIRTLPGQQEADIRNLVVELAGNLADRIEILAMRLDLASESPTGTPLWSALDNMASRFHPGSRVMPFLGVGASDARFFRRQGSVAYGFGMFSDRIGIGEYLTMYHGDDERVDVASLQMSAEMFEALAREFLS